VPGNHEYYPAQRGREFFDIFCTTTYQNRWDEYGLRLVPQPGTYWELRDPDRRGDLVVIGLDSGQTGNLDGHHDWWRIWKRREKRDTEQMVWLRQRLDKAEKLGHKVIILFHIPAMANQERKDEVHLETIHRIIAEYSCVKLVTGGHEHNCQIYDREILRKFLIHKQGCNAGRLHVPEYIVCGGGGAYLTSTDFGSCDFICRQTFPDANDWRDQAGYMRPLKWLEKNAVGRFVYHLQEIYKLDKDRPRFLSLLMVRVSRKASDSRVEVTPVWMRDLESLYRQLPPDAEIRITDKNQKIDEDAYQKCLEDENGNRTLVF
jgi:hypothetical protein